MRRILSLLLALALCAAALPARAELPLVYPAETVISVLRLTDTQRQLAYYLYGPVLAGEEKIELPAGTRYDDVGPAMQCLMLDYPEMFHLDRTYTISYWQNEPEVAIAVTPSYRMDAQTAALLRRQLYAQAMEMVRADPTALGLHDSLVARVSYGGDAQMRHTAVGAILYGQATCEGYAQAMTLLCRMAGIPCGIVTGVGVENATGQASAHSWNILDLNGCTLVDVTWDDQEGARLNTRWYFGLSTAQMSADHIPDADMAVPPCYDHAGWQRATGRVAHNREDAFRAVQALVTTGDPLNLRIADPALYRAIASDTGAFLDAYNEWCPPGCEFYGSYTYLTCDAQQCIIMLRRE